MNPRYLEVCNCVVIQDRREIASLPNQAIQHNALAIHVWQNINIVGMRMRQPRCYSTGNAADSNR